MTSSLIPPSTFLPICPALLPDHEPRQGRAEYLYLSDTQTEGSKDQFVQSALYPFPINGIMKWIGIDEVYQSLMDNGYDDDLVYSILKRIRHVNYHQMKPYYMHKEQLRRNKKRALARKKAELLVGRQTPPEN